VAKVGHDLLLNVSAHTKIISGRLPELSDT